MANFEVRITMSVATVEALQANGAFLYSLKAVQSSSQAGRPLVWRQSKLYSTSTPVAWTSSLAAYTSFSEIKKGDQIEIGFSAAIQTGQTLEVKDNGIGTVVAGGPADQVSILNTVQSYFTCGLLQDSGAFCAFPLYGLHQQSFKPVEKILLMFSTDDLPPRTVVDGALQSAPSSHVTRNALISPGVLIDMTGTPSVAVTYDINKGWTWAASVNAQPVPANANLVPLLIEPES